jgi:hypothetical protein
MSATPQASYESVVAKLHRQYGQQIANLNQELAITAAALDEALEQLNQPARENKLVENTPAGYVPKGFTERNYNCAELDYDVRGDCDGPIGRRIVARYQWGLRPGESVHLCDSHQKTGSEYLNS